MILRTSFLLLVLAATLVSRGGRAADRETLALAAASITSEELKDVVGVLADDTFEGREAGSRGGHAAANYIVKAFEKLGARPAGDCGSYFQAFNGTCRNILAVVPGSDEQLKDQYVVLCAHYDHVGYGRSNNSFGPLGYIHNGADDNASGVAGLLEVLDAIHRLPAAPRRSVLLACFDSEESGLQGSRFWISRPTVPLEKVAMAINIDMIGRLRDNRIELFGSRTAPGLRRTVSEANGESGPTIDFDWKLKADSDHWSFIERRIPVMMFHTGLHGDYHRPSDDAHLINYDGLETTARLTFQTLMRLTEAGHLPRFRDSGRQESGLSPASLEQPTSPHPPRFGMPFHVEAGNPPRFIVGTLNPGLPAERAGMKAGDRLLEFDGTPIRNDADFRLQLLAARGESVFLVEREGVATPQLLKVTPQGEPLRVGITWRLDDGEPGTAIITQVIHGSAAYAADMKVGDRIYAIAGRGFSTQTEIVALLSKAAGNLEMLIERHGRLHTARLTLLDEPPAAAE
jgi:hypothetical protein